MWNRFKKSIRGSDVKKECHGVNVMSSSVNDNDLSLTRRHDNNGNPRLSSPDVTKLDSDISTPAGSTSGTPNKLKVKHKLSLFGGNKSRAKTKSSDNCGPSDSNGNCEKRDVNSERKRPETVSKTNGSKSVENRSSSLRVDNEVVKRTDTITRVKQDGGQDGDSDKRQSGLSDVSSSASSTGDRSTRPGANSVLVGGTLDVPDMVDDNDEVFHRRPTTLSTFAATAEVGVSAKPSPPKMKRRTKQTSSIGSGLLAHGAESETRRSRLTKPTSCSGIRSTVEPVQPPTVPTSSPTDSSSFRSPVTSGTSAPGSAKRVPPPVPVRRSSTRNGGSELLSPSRDQTSTGIAPPRTLYSVSSMRSSPGDSGSDDTEGKESGYVTLDDLQAQLMRSSWSSDDREVEQTAAAAADRLLMSSTGLTDSCCSGVSRVMTPDSLMMTSSQTSTTLSCPPTLSVDETDLDDTWPAPPSPIINHLDTPAPSGGQVDTPPAIVTLTFTVKLDSELIKNRTKNRSPTPAHVDDVIPVTTSSTIAIPDVVVCAGAAAACGTQVDRQMTANASLVAVVDSAKGHEVTSGQRDDVMSVIKESRSCQTEPSTSVCSQCVAGHRPEINDDEQDDDVIAGCTCQCRVDDGSYLRPLVTRVYANRSTSTSKFAASSSTSGRETTTSGITVTTTTTTVHQDSEELTHMSWNEVLEEAQTMGIELHPPPGSNYRQQHRQRHATEDTVQGSPSIISCSMSSTIDNDSMGLRTPTRHRQPVINRDDRSTTLNDTSTGNTKKPTKTSFRDIFRWPSKLFSSKKKSSSATVKRSKSLEPTYNMQTRGLPVPPPSNITNNKRRPDTRLSRASSHYSASSCPPTSGHVISTLRTVALPSRTISVASSSTHRGGQSTPDYFIGGSTCSGGGVGTHGGSLPAMHRHRVTSSSTSGGVDQLMMSSFDAADTVDGCCVSPSLSSFSSCSHTAPWRGQGTAAPSTPFSSTCPTSPGLFSSLSMKCSTWKGNKTDFVSSLSELQNYGWYWGALGFDDAESKLAGRPDGSFLVRDSSDERYVLSLSFRSLGGTHHTRIEHYKGSFSFCSQTPDVIANLAPSSTVVEFIESAMAASRAGKRLFFLRPRAPGLDPAPVRLLYAVSRFRCMHSLQHLCKFAVLRHVRLDMVDRLPVPPRLKEYLKHGRPTVD